jgi:hypothetical protein
MKLIIQIPCFNEEGQLPLTLSRLPREVPGFETVESLFADDEFELAAAVEVLEHVSEPERTIRELVRIAARHMLVSVPREPLWRVLNLARGAYPRQLGNTPGHLNHWTSTEFVQLLKRHGEVLAVRTPLPWTMLLVRVR